jgi:hypothetical protein
MDLIDCFRGGDIVFPDAESFLGPDDTGVLDKPESIAGSSGGTDDVGRNQTGIHQFCGRNRLDEGLTPTPAKDKHDVPVLIRLRISHANSPTLSTQNTCVVRTLLCCAAKAVDVLWHLEHCVLDLRQDTRDPAR